MRHVWGGLCPTGAGIAFAGLYGALVRVTGNRADNRAGRHAENSIEQHARAA